MSFFFLGSGKHTHHTPQTQGAYHQRCSQGLIPGCFYGREVPYDWATSELEHEMRFSMIASIFQKCERKMQGKQYFVTILQSPYEDNYNSPINSEKRKSDFGIATSL